MSAQYRRLSVSIEFHMPVEAEAGLPALKRADALPVNYEPAEGLKAVAVAEAAERHFARAKDATRLYEAIEIKLAEQRRFVLWWDGLGDKRGRPEKTSQTTDVFPTVADLGLDRDTIHRWRKKLKDGHSFDAALEAASIRCLRIAEFQRGTTEQKGASGTGVNEWYTPPQYIALACVALGGIDLDPASSDEANKKVAASKFFDMASDGLSQEWHGRVWLNPPYAQPLISDFMAKLVEEVNACRCEAAIALTHNYTDTRWFQDAAAKAQAICFTRGRVKFYSPSGEVAAPTQGQAFFYFGDHADFFAEVFSEVGFVAEVQK